MLTTVIATSRGREDWAAQALASVPGEAIVVSAPGYELGKLSWVQQYTTLDRFLFIQDSVTVSEALYRLLSNFSGSVALLADPVRFGSYIGVYERDLLSKVTIPIISSKKQSVEAEISWTKQYCEVAGDVPVLFPELSDKTATRNVMCLGRENIVLENEYFAKYKGTWRYDQITD